jgi:hypothetical protein
MAVLTLPSIIAARQNGRQINACKFSDDVSETCSPSIKTVRSGEKILVGRLFLTCKGLGFLQYFFDRVWNFDAARSYSSETARALSELVDHWRANLVLKERTPSESGIMPDRIPSPF